MASNYSRTYGYHGHQSTHLSSSSADQKENLSVVCNSIVIGGDPGQDTELANVKVKETKLHQIELIRDHEPEVAIFESITTTDQTTFLTTEYIYEPDVELLSMDSGGTDECSEALMALKTVGVSTGISGTSQKIPPLMTVDEQSMEEVLDDLTLIVPPIRPRHEEINDSEYPLNPKDERLIVRVLQLKDEKFRENNRSKLF